MNNYVFKIMSIFCRKAIITKLKQQVQSLLGEIVALKLQLSEVVRENEELKSNQNDIIAPRKVEAKISKDTLFIWWVSDHFGEQEAIKIAKAKSKIDRVIKAIDVHGDFVAARQSILEIAMMLPDAGTYPADPLNPTLDNESTRKWLEQMRVVYSE